MRKALIAVLMAATIATPLAAQERPGGREGFTQRVQRVTSGNRESRPAPAPRMQRQQQQQPRADRPQQPRFQRERTTTVGQAARPDRQRSWQGRRPEGQTGSRPDRQPVQVRTPAANWPGQQERANRVVNRSVREAQRTERRDDRRDWRNDRRDDRRDWRNDRRDDRRDWRSDRRDDRRDWRNDRRDSRQVWNRNWRNDNRYDWQRYRYSNRNLFQLGRYYAPFNNYRYSRFSIGLFLGQPFYSDRYWINDPWQYRLPPAYAGTRWVRYYDDVMLVDTYSGEVLDVIYDFFW